MVDEVGSYRGRAPNRKGGLRRRAVHAMMIAALVVISSFTVVALAPGSRLPGDAPSPSQVNRPQPQIKNGTGLLKIVVSVPTNNIPQSAAASIINGSTIVLNAFSPSVLPSTVPFTVSATDQVVPSVQRFDVHQPGQFETILRTANYSLAAETPFYNISIFVQILTGQTTELDVSVNATGYQPVISSFLDKDLSGTVGPWDTLNLLVTPGSNTIHSGEVVFLQGLFCGVCVSHLTINSTNLTQTVSVQFQDQAPILEARVLSLATAEHGVWVTISPLSVWNIRGIQALRVVEVASTYVVSIHAP